MWILKKSKKAMDMSNFAGSVRFQVKIGQENTFLEAVKKFDVSHHLGCITLDKFLETEPRLEMAAMLVEKRCPRVAPLTERKTMFEEIAQSVSPDHAERLIIASRAYEAQWDLRPSSPDFNPLTNKGQ